MDTTNVFIEKNLALSKKYILRFEKPKELSDIIDVLEFRKVCYCKLNCVSNQRWIARVDADGMGGLFESCYARSPVFLLFTGPNNLPCVSSQKINIEKYPFNLLQYKT